jgi:tetratricopeptide (TPR) repeat protein
VGAPALPAATKPPLSAQDVVRRLTGAQGPVFVSVSAPRPVASGVPSELVRDLYMLGYHAYWSGQPQKALDSLDQAVSFGADDARSWYYKGFAELDMGRREEAEKSLARAVQLHAQRPTDVAIAKSLERVQGRLRVELQLALSLVRKLKPSDVESSLLVVK